MELFTQPKVLLTLGDLVTFTISGKEFTGQIVSLIQTNTLIAKIRCVGEREVYYYKSIQHLHPTSQLAA